MTIHNLEYLLRPALDTDDLPVRDTPADAALLVPCPDDCVHCQSPETD